MIEYILMFDQICTKSISAFSHVQGIFLWDRQSGGVLLSPSHLRWYVLPGPQEVHTTNICRTWSLDGDIVRVKAGPGQNHDWELNPMILGQTWESSEYTMNLELTLTF